MLLTQGSWDEVRRFITILSINWTLIRPDGITRKHTKGGN